MDATEEAKRHSGTAKAEVRVAAAFTGGVSLAVWMGGVAREMNLLAAASRPEEFAAPTAAADRLVREKYGKLLDLLELDFSIDVLSGTSAGGINAALLGIANVRRRDLGMLRDVWFEQGALDLLLRDPSEPAPPSLLRGDEVLLDGLRAALTELGADAEPRPDTDEDPTRVFITTTLLDGEKSTFTDDYGTAIHDTTHRGLFTFTAEQLASPGAADALALAARSSASFPGAFEPAFVPVGGPGTDGHPDMAPHVNPGVRTQFCADGGLLANRPLGPALEAVFDRGADSEVRRVLAYVVPFPGLAEQVPVRTQESVPALGSALLADFDAVRSQSITAELKAVLAHNAQARSRESAESRLAVLAGARGDLGAGGLLTEFRDLCAGELARTAANQTLRQLVATGRGAVDGRPAGFGTDHDELTWAAAALIEEELPAAPDGDGALCDWLAHFGRPAFDGAKATVLRLLRGAFDATRTDPGARAELGGFVAQAHAAARHAAPAPVKPRLPQNLIAPLTGSGPLPMDVVSRLTGSDAWQRAVRALVPQDSGRTGLTTAWEELATVIVEARDLLGHLLPSDDADPLAAVLNHLTGPAAEGAQRDAAVREVARRLFVLQAAQQVMFPREQAARQTLELLQMSAETRTDLDPRSLPGEKLTGCQVHNFGAFYKSSWRANDWMWGRLDGAGWLVHLLLSPRRLLQLAPPGETERPAFLERLAAGLEEIVGEPVPDEVAAELDAVTSGSAPPPTSLKASRWVAKGLQARIALEELGFVARQAVRDRDRHHAAGERLERFLDMQAAADSAPRDPAVALATAQRLLNACEVSRETFDDEMDTAPMRLTITRGAAVAARAVGAGIGDRWPLVAPVFGAMGGFLRAGHGTHQLCESGLHWVGTRGGRLKSAFASLRGASAQAVRQIGTAGLLEGRGKGDAGP